ncbi:DinB family protein [Gilvimarinus agarilyticus]|uniref:DinB family protein n=1 Tax=unclassified Gilvimarinus TaxID=2642066 RepID=UPI001C086FB2|nr:MULTISPECIES: DinB family protein [unclassified Gilvimarinus]MBU2886325.1 DinB family protein [Gilvimarinus agarilyticus]MDO6571011.1 DinB family protein [Gilvimarinus sp. 2_MG-2023]MDO6747971.1 DinB family protein [Gilvimarinus sp. 1_MG-2023]
MEVLTHLRLMAGYNLRMNRQVYAGAASLSDEQLNKPLGAYFGSVLGTLNHIMVGDLLWLHRFRRHSEAYLSLQALKELPQPTTLDTVIYDRFGALGAARSIVDEAILTWVSEELKPAELSQLLSYQNAKGEAATRDFGELICNLFNHQTHHRGQVSTLLSQLGVDIGPTDFLLDIPQQ